MKSFVFILFLIGSCGFSQKIQLTIIASKSDEQKIIDSIGYNKEFESIIEIEQEKEKFNKKVQLLGYFEVTYQKEQQQNKIKLTYDLGDKINLINVIIPQDVVKYIKNYFIIENSVILKPYQIEDFIQSILYNFDVEGLGFVNIQLVNFRKENNIIYANISINNSTKRTINHIVINGYTKFPKGHYKRLKRSYLNKPFSQETVKKIDKSIQQINFVKQIKYPEVLFKKDSTQVYLYLEKESNNQFDGFMGFSNNENGNFTITGYLDLKLQNIINSGEKLQINWRNDGNNQSSFFVDLSLPLLFNTSFGLETSLNVFKQDSLFQNSKTNLKLTYLFPNEIKIGLGLLQNSSNSISKISPNTIQDFENTFYTLNTFFSKNNFNEFLFPEIFTIDFSLGYGSRNTKLEKQNQYFIKSNTTYHHKFNEKHSFWVKNSNFLLKSDTFLINELERFGGIYSIRGFQENSLQANVLSLISTEYRYKLSPNLYFHTVSDFAYFEDKSQNITNQIFGLGLGMGLNTKNGLFKLTYATGFEKTKGPSFQDALLHFSFVTRF